MTPTTCAPTAAPQPHLSESQPAHSQTGKPPIRPLIFRPIKCFDSSKSPPGSDNLYPGDPIKPAFSNYQPAKQLNIACLFCRERKIACLPKRWSDSPEQPCNPCKHFGVLCIYPAESQRGKRGPKKTPKSSQRKKKEIGVSIAMALKLNKSKFMLITCHSDRKETFARHHRFFGGYLKYYEEYIKDKDISDILEKQIFSLEANFDATKPADKQPAMLDRFLDAIIHPLIHVGYGLELGLPGLLVEGLASTATHAASGSKLLPKSLWKAQGSATVDTLTRLLPSVLRFGSSAKPPSTEKKNVHAFDILARMLKDPAFDNIAQPFYLDVWIIAMEKYGDLIEKHAQAWTYDSSDPNEVNKKLEELVYMNAIIYGVSGWAENEQFNADFLYMHLITTSVFLPTILVYLKPESQELLLRSYLVISIAWWIAHGRTGFDLEAFFAKTSAYPTPSEGKLPVAEHALPNASSFKAATPNPWLHIIQAAITHPDDHVPKLQRALAHWGSVYGTRSAGQADFAGTELKGADKIDGTIFIRTAALTHERTTSFKEGYTNTGAGTWDRKGFKETRDGGVGDGH